MTDKSAMFVTCLHSQLFVLVIFCGLTTCSSCLMAENCNVSVFAWSVCFCLLISNSWKGIFFAVPFKLIKKSIQTKTRKAKASILQKDLKNKKHESLKVKYNGIWDFSISVNYFPSANVGRQFFLGLLKIYHQ